MPYTHKSLAFTWLILFALCALSASGVARGWWFVLLLSIAVAIPALVLKDPTDAVSRAAEQALTVAEAPDQAPLNLGGIDVHGWENEGGARRMPLRHTGREPLHVAS